MTSPVALTALFRRAWLLAGLLVVEPVETGSRTGRAVVEPVEPGPAPAATEKPGTA